MKERELEAQIDDLENRVAKLECPHPLEERKFYVFIVGYQICSACHKEIECYRDQEKYDEAKVKWHKEMITTLEVQDDKKSNL